MSAKGDEASWNVMLDRYTNEQNAQEKKKLLKGLGIQSILKLFKAFVIFPQLLSRQKDNKIFKFWYV